MCLLGCFVNWTLLDVAYLCVCVFSLYFLVCSSMVLDVAWFCLMLLTVVDVFCLFMNSFWCFQCCLMLLNFVWCCRWMIVLSVWVFPMLVLFLFHFDPVLICCMCLIFVSGAFQAFQTTKTSWGSTATVVISYCNHVLLTKIIEIFVWPEGKKCFPSANWGNASQPAALVGLPERRSVMFRVTMPRSISELPRTARRRKSEPWDMRWY